MAEYRKPWLSLDDQVKKLVARGVSVPDVDACTHLLRTVGYYRVTGYLYPFRQSEMHDDGDRTRINILEDYRPGTSIADAAALIDFDRSLRLLVLDGIERIEVSLRTEVAFQLGRRSAFAHLDPAVFVSSFTEPRPCAETGVPEPSAHSVWLERMRERQDNSDESFVAHFRDRYDNRMPIWALTEIMELGHLVRLYRGLVSSAATDIASAYAVPSKKVMQSWIAGLNYVRNVSAHHARLYNRKLVSAPSRPKRGQTPLLDHLRDETSSKEIFGVYNALAVMAFLLRPIEPGGNWAHQVTTLIKRFPQTSHVSVSSLGTPEGWSELELWRQ